MKKLLLFFMSLFTFFSYGQLSEGFEGATFPPTGWVTFDNGIGLTRSWTTTTATGLGWVYAGGKAAIINKEDVNPNAIAEDWMVTPLVAVPTNGQLRFFARSIANGEQGSIYKVKISIASQNNPADFTTTLVTYTELDIINAPFEQKIIPLTAYVGQNVYIAFVMENDNGDAWIVDNVNVDQQCTAIPTVLTATPSNTSANLSWTYTGPATQFAIEYGPAGFLQGTGTTVSPVSNPHVLTGLTAATNYSYYVRALCGSGTDNPGPWSSSTSFTTTLCAPSNQCNFIFRMRDSYGDGWNGATMQVRQSGIVVATIGSTFTAGLGPIDISVPLCNNQPFDLFWNNGGAWPAEVRVEIIDPLSGSIYNMNTSSAGLANTILYSGTAFCTPPTCPRPTAVTLSAVTQTQASINWTENGTATQWQVLVLPVSSPVPTAATPGWRAASARPFIYTGLSSGTQYKAYVRSICNPGVDESITSNGTTFATQIANDNCINATVTPVNDDTSCLQTASGSLVGATASTPASTCAGTADDDVWFQFTATSTTHFVTLTNVAGSTTNLVHVLYSGSCASLTRLYCSTILSSTANGLVIGQTYFVRVYSNTSTPGQTSTFNLCIGTPVSCSDANAFCGDTGLVYTNSTGAPSYGSIGCLFTSPNPSWYFMQVNQSGSLNFQIAQTSATGGALDVDYVIWGPFTPAQFATSCNNLYDFPDGNTSIPNNIASCSYSASSIENFAIANANLNDIYLVLITNYSNNPGTVTFTQTGGTGATNCDIVCSNNIGADQVFCDTATYQINSSNTTADNYAWYFNNVLISGVNTSSITVSQTGTYKCVITCGINNVQDEIILTFNTAVAPTFTAIAPFCENTAAPVLPITSNNGIPGTWVPSVISNTASGNYVFTPNTGICASPVTISVTVTPQVTPSFIAPASICAGDAAPVLPTTSNNGITGAWSPMPVDNMASATYTFTPNGGQCATSTTLDVNVIASCTFGTVASAVMIDNCSTTAPGEFFNTTAGSETIGTATNVFPNSNLGTYVQNSGNLFFNGAELRTFKTPTANVCSARLNYRIYEASSAPGAFVVVNLPWLDDCVASTYPTGGNCNSGDQKWQNITTALNLTTNIPGNYIIEVFYDVTGDDNSTVDCLDTILLNNGGANYKANFTIQSMPTFVFTNPTTCNGTEGSITISGFNPGDTYSITYTDNTVTVGPANFIADVTGDIIFSGLNAGTYADFNFMVNGCTITDNTPITLVNPVYTSTFNQIGPFCVGDAIVLPSTSIEGFTGAWTPAVDNTQTTTYTFTPDTGQCATVNNSYVVTVNPAPSLTSVTATTPICIGQDAVFIIVGSPNTTLDYNLNSGITQSIPIPASGTVSITVTSPAVGNVVLNLLDIDNGTCNTVLTNTTTVIVRALPTVTDLSAIDASICLGSDAAFTITGTPNATVTYQIDSGANQTVVLNAAGQSGTITITNPTADVVVLLVDINDGVCNAAITDTITIVVNPIPSTPTISTITQPTCALQTGAFNVLSPLNSLLNTPGDLFISEVTDRTAGSATSPALSYIEIYNGTGAPVDLSNYKLKIYTAPVAGCVSTLSGMLANNDVVVINISGNANLGGVVPDLTISCGGAGFNTDDRVVLTTLTDVEVDSWGIQGTTFTPNASTGYNYRRNTSAPLPSTVWDPSDWTAIDWDSGTEDYSDVGNYTLYSIFYEYILNDGTTPTTQTSTSYTLIAPGTYTLIAHNLMTGCFSEAFEFTINGVPYSNPVTNITYVTPVCILATTNPLPDTSIVGFTSDGKYTINSTDATIDEDTGEIDLATSIAGTYMVTYTFVAVATSCTNLGSSQFEIVITDALVPTFNSIEVCAKSLVQLPAQSIEGYTGTWSPASIDTSVQGTTVYYFTPDASCSEVGEFTVIVDNCTIQKGISPNGDSLNDYFDLSSFDVSKLQIFNRYGVEVYSKSNYTIEWKGQANNGNALPDGTYYYVIEFNDMDSKTGWIYINKER